MKRPPPYFPQNQLSPPDENRYKKLKAIFALLILAAVIIIGAIGYGLYYLIATWMA